MSISSKGQSEGKELKQLEERLLCQEENEEEKKEEQISPSVSTEIEEKEIKPSEDRLNDDSLIKNQKKEDLEKHHPEDSTIRHKKSDSSKDDIKSGKRRKDKPNNLPLNSQDSDSDFKVIKRKSEGPAEKNKLKKRNKLSWSNFK